MELYTLVLHVGFECVLIRHTQIINVNLPSQIKTLGYFVVCFYNVNVTHARMRLDQSTPALSYVMCMDLIGIW